RDPGAGGTLGEDQADGLAAERGLAVLACAHLLCELEQVEQLGAGDVLEREEVALGCHEPSWERGRPEWQESNWSLVVSRWSMVDGQWPAPPQCEALTAGSMADG